MGLAVTGLSFAVDSKTILADVSFEAPAGAVTALLGANGSGKTTLLRILAGVHPCHPGFASVEGRDLAGLRGRERAALVGYLPQFHRPVFAFRVEDVVLTGRAAFIPRMPRRSERERVDAVLHELGIEHLAKRSYAELSGGERQMVMIARVLVQDPRVILFDEPTAHLDLGNQGRFLGLLKSLAARGKIVLTVLHDPNLAFAAADRLVFLRAGRVMSAPGSDWDPDFLFDVYGALAQVAHVDGRPFLVPRVDRGHVAPGSRVGGPQ